MEIGPLWLAGTVLCTAGLSVSAGFWAGRSLAKAEPPEQSRRAKPPFYLPDVLDLIEQSRQLHTTFTPFQQQIPAGLMAAVLQVFKAAETLHKKISIGTFSGSGDQVSLPTSDSTPIERTAPSLSTKELMNFALESPSNHAESEGIIATDRKQYDMCQNMAFYSAELPAAREFEQVQCNDLSVDGISFILNRRPEQEYLVISLGTPPDLIFLSAKVANVRLLLHEGGLVAYRVGCRFLNRLDPPRYRWNAEKSGIESLGAK